MQDAELKQRRERLAVRSEIERAQLRAQARQLQTSVRGLWTPMRAWRGPLAIGAGIVILLLLRRRPASRARAVPRAAALQPRNSLLNHLRSALEVAGALRGFLAQTPRR